MALAIDATTPAWVSSTATVTTLTTAAFSPPANSLLVVLWANGFTGAGLTSVTDSLSAVTWQGTAKVSELNGTHEGAQIWLGQVGSSAPGSLTVTAHFPSNGSQALGVVVVTGAAAAASQTGATKVATSASGAPSGTIASLVGANSLILGAVANGSNTTLPTIPAGQSDSFNAHTYAAAQNSAAGWAQYLTGMNLAAGSAATINDTAPSTIDYSMAVLEILAAGGGGGGVAAAPVVARLMSMGVGS